MEEVGVDIRWWAEGKPEGVVGRSRERTGGDEATWLCRGACDEIKISYDEEGNGGRGIGRRKA